MAVRRNTVLQAVPCWFVVTVLAWLARPALSQTPSPLQEWQYSSGVLLASLFEPDLPKWRYTIGVGADVQPLYDGSKPYRVQGGPLIDIRYRDIAFASVGEGVGVNLLRSADFRAGIAVAYDLGRRTSDDQSHLHGLGDIPAAPVIRLFAERALSKKFPLIVRANVRQFIGGADGATGDLEFYTPLPGSSSKLILFLGPTISFADRLYLQKQFGVNHAQAVASGYPTFQVHPGMNAEGLGFTAIRIIHMKWLITLDAAIDRLRGSAAESPITQRTTQRVLDLSAAYTW